MNTSKQTIEVKASDEDLKGRFSNMASISHQKDQFTLDFFFIATQNGQLVSRVIVSPEHMKGLLVAIQDQVKKYEKTFSTKIEVKKEDRQIGFHA